MATLKAKLTEASKAADDAEDELAAINAKSEALEAEVIFAIMLNVFS